MSIDSIAVIPARGGSKGIPGKNIAMLAGKPLIAYIIEAALEAANVHRVYVSTDSPEIAVVAKKHGSDVIMRPTEISGDNASSESALLHVLETLEQTENYHPEILVFLQCTSPLTTAEDIDGTINALYEAEADTALAVTPFHYFLWKVDNSGNAFGINHEKSIRPFRQELEPQYLETGAVYVIKAEPFRKHKHRFFGKTAIYVMPEERRWEIDEPMDLVVAQVILRKQNRNKRLRALPESISAMVFGSGDVFTDDQVTVDQDEAEAIVCSRSDALCLSELKKTAIPIVVLSTEENQFVSNCCKKLGIECLQSRKDKAEALTRWAQLKKIRLENTIFLGKDDNDLECLKIVGCPIAVSDSVPAVQAASSIVLTTTRGRGTIRELADMILAKIASNLKAGGTNVPGSKNR